MTTTTNTPKIPEKLLDKYRYCEVECEYWSEAVKEDFTEDMAAIGVGVDEIHFSISYSQGDGACFDGGVENWGKYLEHLGYAKDDPQHRHLHQLVQNFDSDWYVSWFQSGRYCHENSVRFDTNLNLPDDPQADFDEHFDNDSFIDNYCPYSVDDLRARVWWSHIRKYDAGKLEAEIKENLKGHMQDLYQKLVAEYEYFTSDEVVSEFIIANDLLGEEDEPE